eukprot:CAMPEP_0169422158 /NCGR_PEP_ID=MMETSP1017-20121227/66737_1 /TAXON_ID=342587 /ORGANISM="Karlodinium micrum, Strain CCMP2283" /LENGTH=72 /DNA_ID=CAMNT_0009531615 /DNA_START=512 /DNA_END=730 /DNA_ORIENTATION=+
MHHTSSLAASTLPARFRIQEQTIELPGEAGGESERSKERPDDDTRPGDTRIASVDVDVKLDSRLAKSDENRD